MGSRLLRQAADKKTEPKQATKETGHLWVMLNVWSMQEYSVVDGSITADKHGCAEIKT